jgi:hypothetical protein
MTKKAAREAARVDGMGVSEVALCGRIMHLYEDAVQIG